MSGAVGVGEETVEEGKVENTQALCCGIVAFPVCSGQSFCYHGSFQALSCAVFITFSGN